MKRFEALCITEKNEMELVYILAETLLDAKSVAWSLGYATADIIELEQIIFNN